MDRLLAALSSTEVIAILDVLLEAGRPLEQREIRAALGMKTDDRSQLSRQVAKLTDIGLLENAEQGGFGLSDAEGTDAFLQAAADFDALVAERRAAKARAAARARRKRRMEKGSPPTHGAKGRPK
jgi:DNA-binding IclR family transcriptional regulator